MVGHTAPNSEVILFEFLIEEVFLSTETSASPQTILLWVFEDPVMWISSTNSLWVK